MLKEIRVGTVGKKLKSLEDVDRKAGSELSIHSWEIIVLVLLFRAVGINDLGGTVVHGGVTKK